MITTPQRWVPAQMKFIEFANKFPELGISTTSGAWIHFARQDRFINALIDADVFRRAAYRNRLIAEDTERTHRALFNLITTGSVDGKAAS